MQQNPPSDKPEMRMEMRMHPVAVNEQGLGPHTPAAEIGSGPVEPISQADFEHPNGVGHDPQNPPNYDWNTNEGALPEAHGSDEGLLPTHWSLVHAPIIAGALEQLNDIEDIDVRTWLGNLYLVYQQQCGSVAIDWAMVFTDVELLDDPAGALFALSHINRDYDIRLMETHDGYYVTRAVPEDGYTVDDMYRMWQIRLDTHEVVSPMFGADHARNLGNGVVSMFNEAIHEYFQFGEEGSQINPLIEAVRTMLMYLVDQGYTSEREFTVDDFNVDEGAFRLVHREWPVAVDITFNLAQIKAQYDNMLRQVKRESEANMAGLVSLEEPESQSTDDGVGESQ